MKLLQGQTWNLGDQYVRIVALERLIVEYKVMKNLQTREGSHETSSKKEFCRLIKHAILMTPEEVRGILEEFTPPPIPAPATAVTGDPQDLTER